MKLIFLLSFILHVMLVRTSSINRSQTSENVDYLVIIPKILTNSKESACMVWLNKTKPTNEIFELKLRQPGYEEVVQHMKAPMTSDSVCVQFSTEELRSNIAEIEIILSGKVLEKHHVQMRSPVNLVFIETSKPVYKPSETVQFNVIVVDQNLKPVSEKFKKIWIENPNTSPIKEWSNVQVNDGILSFSFDTAKENVLGNWAIKTLTKDNYVAYKVFELNKYYTSKIDIEVVEPTYVLHSDNSTKIKINVNNQHHYPIHGRITVAVSYKPQFDLVETLNNNSPIQKWESEFDGSWETTLDHSKLQIPHYPYQDILLVQVEIVENETNYTQTLIQEVPISYRSVLVTLPPSRMGKQYFKPNLPFRSYFTVEKPDLTSAKNERITVCYEQRHKSWISETETCKEYLSNQEGVVEYEIKQVASGVEQLFLTVYHTAEPENKKSFVIQPYHSTSEVEFVIYPAIKRSKCSNKHKLELIFYNVTEKFEAFYQVVGRQIEQPVKFVVDPSQMHQLHNNLRKLELQIDSKTLSSVHQPITRIVVYYKDHSQTLVADYDTFEVNCEDQDLGIDVKSYVNDKTNYEFDVNLNTDFNSKCIMEVSQKPYRYQRIKRQIARLMEQLDVNLDLINRDRCERELFNRYQRNGINSALTIEWIVNYKSSYEVFNKAGLNAISNMDLDQAPCEVDVYPEGFSQEMSANFESTNHNLLLFRNYYLNEVSTKLEQGSSNDFVQWVSVDNEKHRKVVVPTEKLGKNSELYFNVLCVNPQNGFQFGQKQVAHNNLQPFHVEIVAPRQLTVNENSQIYVLLHKDNHQQVEVLVEPIKNHFYEITLEKGQSNKFNLNRNHYKLVYNLKATKPSKTQLQFLVGHHDGSYPTKIHSVPVEIVQQGSLIRNTEYQIVSSEKPVVLVEGSNENEKQEVKKLTAYTNILHMVLPKQNKYEKMSDPNSMQHKSPLELVNYLTILLNAEHDNQNHHEINVLKNEIERIYQILESKHLPDGSYSSSIGDTYSWSNLPLTSTIFNLYYHLKEKKLLPQVSQLAIKHTYMYLNKLQNEQGSFTVLPQTGSVFPLNLNDTYDLTSYVVMQLAQTKLNIENPTLKKAVHYLSKQIKNPSSSQHEQTSHLFAKSVLAYVYALKKNLEKSNNYLQKINLSNLKQVEQQRLGEEIIAVNLLTAIELNKKSEVERLAKHMFSWSTQRENKLFSSPVISKAIVRAWSYMSLTQPEFSVNGKKAKNGTVYLGDTKVLTVNSDKYVFVTYKKEQYRMKENQHHFKLSVDGLERGFWSTYLRSINVCYKTKLDNQVVHSPVINVQIPTGFVVDEPLLKNILVYGTSSQLESFDVRQQNIHLLLKPIYTKKNACIEIPIIQVQKVTHRQKSYVQIVDYYQYQKQLSSKKIADYDTIFYELPTETKIINRPLFSFINLNLPRVNTVNEVYEQHHNSLEVINCPEDFVDTCPICMEEINKSEEKEICGADFSSVVSQREVSNVERKMLNQTHSKEHKNKCVVLPLKLENILNSKNHHFENQNQDVLFYVNEKCRCSYIHDKRGHSKAILVKQQVENSHSKTLHQLTEEDKLVIFQRDNEVPSCQTNDQRRSKRSTEANNETKTEKTNESEKRNTNYAQKSYGGYNTQAPTSGYAALADAYTSNNVDYSASAPAYNVPTPAPTYGAATPAYNVPAQKYETKSGYSAAAPAYAASAPKYEAKSSYAASSPTYNTPNFAPKYDFKPGYAATPVYAPPAQKYETKSGYGAAAPAYAVSAPKYEVKSGYATPAQKYEHKSDYAPVTQTYSSPSPAYGTPSPAYSTPAPAYGSPAPTYGSPAPVYGTPAPAYGSPAPVYGSSAPVYVPPTQAYAPAPVYGASPPTYSAPTYGAPVPAYNTPNSYDQSAYEVSSAYGQNSYQLVEEPKYIDYAQTYEQPQSYSLSTPHEQSYAQSTPTYGMYAQVYADANPSYGTPSVYETSAPTYGESNPSYAPNYGEAAPTYAAPSSYEAPAPVYHAQSPSYNTQTQTYSSQSPAYNSQAPAYNAPSQAYSAQTSAYNAPTQAYNTPGPAYNAQAPAYNSPAPSYNAPSSSYSAQTPAYNAPAQAYNAPAYNAPAQAYNTPAPAYNTPAPTYNTPAPTYNTPAPPYNSPAPAYNSPAQSYNSPAQAYNSPSQTYNTPGPAYNAPAQTHNVPAQMYNAPTSSYNAQSSYNTPPPVYVDATPAYAAPSSGYADMTQSYGAPASSYNPPASAYSSPSPSYGSHAPAYGTSYAPETAAYGVSHTYKKSVGGSYKPTQPEYTQPQYNHYGTTPGYINKGYYLQSPKPYAAPSGSDHGYPASSTHGYAVVPAPVYAAASERRNIFSKAPTKCDVPAKTCPVCEDIFSFNLINDICKLDVIALATKFNQTVSIKNQSVCGKMNLLENMHLNDKQLEYTLNDKCECPQLKNANTILSHAIILAPKGKMVDNKIDLDEDTYVLNDYDSILREIYYYVEKCKSITDNVD